MNYKCGKPGCACENNPYVPARPIPLRKISILEVIERFWEEQEEERVTPWYRNPWANPNLPQDKEEREKYLIYQRGAGRRWGRTV
jgi:hypothetical protein